TSGLLQSGGFVDSLLEAFLRQANTRRKLMVLTSPLMIITVGLGAALSFAAVLLGTLLAPAYKKMGLESKNLSRTMEDSGTTYDAFWPWGGGGVFAAGALGVATLDYMPFMFFAFFSTAAGIIVALTQFKVATIPDDHADEEEEVSEESKDSSATESAKPHQLSQSRDRKSTRLNSSHVSISYAVSGTRPDLRSFPTRRSSDLPWTTCHLCSLRSTPPPLESSSPSPNSRSPPSRTITQMKRKKSPKNLKIQALRSPPSPTSFRSRARSPPVALPPATHSKSRFTLLFPT